MMCTIKEEGEQKVFELLARRDRKPSYSCNMYRNWAMDRNKIKKILGSLDDDRMLQTTFGNLIGATRFKTIKEGELRGTVCPKCKKAVDTWKHCVECHEIQFRSSANEKQWLRNIRTIMETVKTTTPGKFEAADTPFGGNITQIGSQTSNLTEAQKKI